jgi:hypothetical protein
MTREPPRAPLLHVLPERYGSAWTSFPQDRASGAYRRPGL